MTTPSVLVTGGCGYLGAHLLREMAGNEEFQGAHVRILDNLSSGSIASLCDLPTGPRFEFIEGDILSPAVVRLALEGMDSVVHLAALVRTPFAFNQPASIQQINQWGTVQLLEQCRLAGIRRFVYTSSVSVYGPGGPFEEQMACRPLGPYSQSKLNAEHAVLSANSATLSSVVLRLATLYGGQPALMRFDAVANRFAYLAGTSRSLAVFGSGEQTRPLIHVQDAARAIMFMLQQAPAIDAVYNIVESNPTVESLAEMIAAIQPGTRIRYTDQDYREHFSLAVSQKKACAAGWTARERMQPAMERLMAHFSGLALGAMVSLDIAETDD